MKYLTIDYIHEHSRIDFACEDAELELLGNSAEETVMNLLGRDYDDIVAHFGTEKVPVPAAIINATLMLVDHLYTHRSPGEPVTVSVVPYGFDLLLKPYIRLAGTIARPSRHKACLTRLDDLAQWLDYKFGTPADEDAAELKVLRQTIDDYRQKWSALTDPILPIVTDMEDKLSTLETDISKYINKQAVLSLLQ